MRICLWLQIKIHASGVIWVLLHLKARINARNSCHLFPGSWNRQPTWLLLSSKLKAIWCFILSFVSSFELTQLKGFFYTSRKVLRQKDLLKDLSLARPQLAGQERCFFCPWETCETALEICSWCIQSMSWCTQGMQRGQCEWVTQSEGICCPCSLMRSFGESRTRIFWEG